MTLLALAWSEQTQQIDLQVKPSDFLHWLENAVTVSLFTDARCEPDELPPGETDQRGYHGDSELPEGESLGSKLWTLKREKIIPDTINRARDYAEQALEWLVDAEHLKAVKVQVKRGDLQRIDLLIQCQLQDGSWLELYRDYRMGEADAI